MSVDQLPYDKAESNESYATDCGAGRVQGSGLCSASCAIESGLVLFFNFIFFD